MRLKFLLLLLISALLITGCGNSGASVESSSNGDVKNDDQVVLRMSNLSTDQSLINLGFIKFKEVAEQESNGKLKVEIYNSGTFASSDEQQYEMLQTGALDFSTIASYTVAKKTNDKRLNLFDLPFLFRNQEDLYKVIESPYGQQLISDLEESSGLIVVGFIDLGTFSISNSKREVRTPEDLKGLKIRSTTAEITLDTMKALGTNPTPIAYGEVFTSLQQGTVDGLTTATPFIYTDRFYEASNNLTLTRHVPLVHILMMNKEYYESLPADLKEAVDKARAEHLKHARELSIQAEKDAIEGLQNEGVNVVELTEEELEKFKAAVKPVYDKHVEIIGREHYEELVKILEQ